MPPGAALRATAAVALVPLLVLLALAVTGDLAWGPALAAMAVVLAGAAALALLWRADVLLVLDVMRRAGPGGDPAVTGKPPRLAVTAALMAEAERLSRTLAARAAEAERRLRAEQALIERLPDPLVVFGADRIVRRANAAARTAFGAELSAVLRHPGLHAALDRAVEGGTGDADLFLPAPVMRDIHATAIALDAQAQQDGATGGRRLAAVLSDRTRERAVERMRADFVANASHELRTPLTSLIGFIDTLRGPAADDPPAQARFLGIMAEQAERMNRLIDELLSLSRIELTEHQPPQDRVDMDELVQRMAAAFEPRVAARRIRLDVQVAEGLPPVLGDADQLEQVLQNLLDNAVKYGREGGVVRVSAASAAPDGRWPARPGIVLSVADEGQGIARRHLPRLTERFYRVDTGRSRALGGTGLGLAIVKHIVSRHRGQLAIESEEGAGTTASVWLPAA